MTHLLCFCYHLTDQKFLFLNPAFKDFFDTSDKDISPQSLYQKVHEEDREFVRKQVDKFLNSRVLSGIECRIMKNNAECWLRFDAYIAGEGKDVVIVGHAEDISVYRQHNDNMNRHNSKKNAILNILAHDLSGPIGVVGNLVQLIQKETSEIHNERLDEYVNMIGKISKKSILMIRNFIDQEFLESENVTLVKKRVELVSKISATLEEYLLMEKQLNINFDCKANKDKVYTDIDEDKFMQVVNNLISNALKFTPDGGLISIFIEDRESSVRLAISDTGIGIPVKFHSTLFEKFTNARRTGLKGEHSNGLGMSIIKTIVEWHEGKIWFTSEENKGTTFYIELPR